MYVYMHVCLTPGKTLKLELSNTSKIPVSPLGLVKAVYIHTYIHIIDCILFIKCCNEF